MKVFVYGSLKYGFDNHYLLENSKFLGKAISYDKFDMFNLGSYPAIVFNASGSRLVGEVYEISEDTLKDLDYLEGYPKYYSRKLIKVEGDEGLTHLTYVYFLDKLPLQVKPSMVSAVQNLVYWKKSDIK